MARITPIDVIKGISGKYGGNSNDYFATNKSSSKIHLAKFANPYTSPSTEKQVAQRIKFTERQMAITAWLNANKPSEANGMKGTAAYQWAQKMKKSMALSSITQVLYKYLDEENNIVLPEGAGASTEPSDSVTEKYLLTLAVNEPQMGSVSGGGEYAADTEVELKATANSGYVFVKWSDGDTNASRTYTTTAEAVTLTAEFKAEAEDGGEMGE